MDEAVAAAWIAAGVAVLGTLSTVILQWRVLKDQRRWQVEDAERRRRDDRAAAAQQEVTQVIKALQHLQTEMQSVTLLTGGIVTRWWALRRLINQVSVRQADYVAAVFSAKSLGDSTLNSLLDALGEKVPDLGGALSAGESVDSPEWKQLIVDLGNAQKRFVTDAARHITMITTS